MLLGMTSFIFVAHAQDVLDDQAELGYQNAVNQILNTYNPLLSSIDSELQGLQTQGLMQCKIAESQAIGAANAGADQAAAQALQGMIEPGAETVGHVLESAMAGAGGEKAKKEEQLKNLVQACNDSGILQCTNNGARVDLAGCKAQGYNQLECSSEARGYTEEITTLNTEIDELGSGMNELIGSGVQLAAAGFTGNMVKKKALENAAAQVANAGEMKKLCQVQLANQIAALQRQKAELAANKARDLMGAKMAGEYDSRQRRKNNEEDDDGQPTGTIAVNLPDDLPVEFTPDYSSLFNADGSDGGSGGAPGGAPASGGGDSAEWAFGGGSGNGSAGGSPLPPQSSAGDGWSGAGSTTLNAANKGGGFGKGFSDFKKEDEKGDRAPAAAIQGVGDGGIRVMLARNSLIHSTHASTLLKSLDFNKLSRQQKEKGREAASVTNSLK